MVQRYVNRRDAGRHLAERLARYKGKKDALILALPRGGVAVGVELAKNLDLPMDLMLVRKLGVPGDEEFAMGAIAMGDVCFVNEETVNLIRIPQVMIDQVIKREKEELARRNEVYRGGAEPPDLKEKTVILVDDGMATGADMRVAAQAARQLGASRVVVAVPVSSDSAYDLLKPYVDEIVVLQIPPFFPGVGYFYQSFDQMEDSEVLALMEEAKRANFLPL